MPFCVKLYIPIILFIRRILLGDDVMKIRNIIVFCLVVLFVLCACTSNCNEGGASEMTSSESLFSDTVNESSYGESDVFEDSSQGDLSEENSYNESSYEENSNPDVSTPEESSQPDVSTPDKPEREVLNYKYVKAIWVSQYDMSSLFVSDKSVYTAKVEKLVENIKKSGLNTVIFQIRPFGDSFYESEFYPKSRFVSNCNFDPVEIFVNTCRENKLSVHAWINPYRLETPENIEKQEDSPIKSLLVRGKLCLWNDRYYLDPSDTESIKLVCDGAKEALLKYNFDGLHMDDYFYPTTSGEFDKKSFESSGETDLSVFREKSVNKLVRALYEVTKSVDERLIYGISPAGNLNTVRQTSYADVEKWCGDSGYIDYIMPQVYFGFLHGTCPFDKTVDAWSSIVKNPDVKLIVGITLDKAAKNEPDRYAVTEEGKNEWINHKDIIKRSIEYVYATKGASGLALFSYQHLFVPSTGEENPSILEERKNFEGILLN